MNMIILAGMPASGKTYVSREIASALGFPLVAKDKFKESLFDTLGWKEYPEKRRLDYAANAVLLDAVEIMLENGISVLIDDNFDEVATRRVNELIDTYKVNCVTVFFDGDADAFYRRYIERDNAHARHLGHIIQDHYPPFPGECTDYEMTREEFRQKFEFRGIKDFRCHGKRIDIDATDPTTIDVKGLIQEIRKRLAE